jgi:predicted Zn-dependent peptidase
MFADNIEDIAYSYGRQAYRVEKNKLVDVETVQNLVRDYIRDIKENEESEGIEDNSDFINDLRNEDGEIDLDKAEEIIKELNPEDIVNSALLYDNEDNVSWLWENILEPNEIWGIKTDD